MKVYMVYTYYTETFYSPNVSEWEKRQEYHLVTLNEHSAIKKKEELGYDAYLVSYDLED